MRFRRDEFDAWVEPLGLKTVAAKARFTKIDPGQFYRVYHGQEGPGGTFASRVLSAEWPGRKPPAFEDFFEFVEAAA